MTRLPHLPFRLFYALLRLGQREIAQSAYFNPLHALEFRPESDRVTNKQMLELVRQVPGEEARRLVALTVLSLFRMLRYLALADALARESSEVPKRYVAVVYLVLSVLRSDARPLAGFLRHRSGPLLAKGFDADLFRLPARKLSEGYDGLLARAHDLRDIKATLGGVAANLRLEMRRAFERNFLRLIWVHPSTSCEPQFNTFRPTYGRLFKTQLFSSERRSGRTSMHAASSTTTPHGGCSASAFATMYGCSLRLSALSR